LILRKQFKGLAAAQYPKDLAFHVTGRDAAGTEIFKQSIPYSRFTKGKYVIPNVPAGVYTVTETGGKVPGYTLTVKHGTLPVRVGSGSIVTVQFVNQYAKGATPPSPPTGDNTGSQAWLVLLACAAAGAGGMALRRKKQS